MLCYVVGIIQGRTLTGAWIETCISLSTDRSEKVAPLRVRGLKLAST